MIAPKATCPADLVGCTVVVDGGQYCRVIETVPNNTADVIVVYRSQRFRIHWLACRIVAVGS